MKDITLGNWDEYVSTDILDLEQIGDISYGELIALQGAKDRLKGKSNVEVIKAELYKIGFKLIEY